MISPAGPLSQSKPPPAGSRFGLRQKPGPVSRRHIGSGILDKLSPRTIGLLGLANFHDMGSCHCILLIALQLVLPVINCICLGSMWPFIRIENLQSSASGIPCYGKVATCEHIRLIFLVLVLVDRILYEKIEYVIAQGDVLWRSRVHVFGKFDFTTDVQSPLRFEVLALWFSCVSFTRRCYGWRTVVIRSNLLDWIMSLPARQPNTYMSISKHSDKRKEWRCVVIEETI